MQINNNYYNNYQATTSNNQTVKSDKSSFDSMISSSQDTKQEEVRGRFLKFADEHNSFASFTDNEKKLFRDILRDDKITKEEMDSLTYEQTIQLKDIVFMKNLSNEDFGKTPLIDKSNQIQDMLMSSTTSNNQTFNQAVYRTSKQMDNDIQRSTFLSQLSINLSQEHFGLELMPSFYAGVESKNIWDKSQMNLNYDDFLSKIISLHEKNIANPPIKDPIFIKQHQERLDGYNILLKHYNDVKGELKYV